ncbi:hypothetical protein SAMN05216581_1648 [Pseudomonas asplenii]|uniref:Uncharacterized protein n=1 Tax=Pseudomonas asplenii TaxID=53407 RepID=A0A1H6MUZ2_9PSED|nr:hypothetical protein SAMN05216581_1648 [Pseudomonas fuscovaginae]
MKNAMHSKTLVAKAADSLHLKGRQLIRITITNNLSQ